MNKSRPIGQIVLLLLSVAGIGIAIYLTAVHYEHVPLVCSTHGFVDCSLVLSSPFSVVPGTSIPITVPGLFWSLVSAGLAITGLRLFSSLSSFSSTLRNIRIAQFAWSLVGMCTVLYLVYVEIVKLHTICAWCTALHVVILTMFLITLVQLQQRPDVEEETEPEMELESDRV